MTRVDNFPVIVRSKTSDDKTILGHLDYIEKGIAYYPIFSNGMQRSTGLMSQVRKRVGPEIRSGIVPG